MIEKIIGLELAKEVKRLDIKLPSTHYYVLNLMNFKETGELIESEGKCTGNLKGQPHLARACTQNTLIQWLRKEKLISVAALPYREEKFEDNKIMWYYSVVNLNEEGDILCNEVDLGTVESDFFDTYESALEEGLKQGLTLIEI